MGLLVHSGVLPNGIPIQNVYISFGQDCLRIAPIPRKSGWFCINTTYSIYSSPSKDKGTNMRFEIFVETQEPTKPIYDIVYNYLKSLYPDSENIL
jgi:hypothetical protein